MKRIISVLLCTMLFAAASNAQSSYDTPLRVVVQSDGISSETGTYLHDRLQYLVAGSGMATNNVAARFYVYPVLSERSSILSGSVPPMYTVEYDMTLFVADLLTGKVYSRYETRLKGVGRSGELAERNAVAGMDRQREGLDAFIAGARSEILAYYKSEGETVLKSAATAAAMHDYSQALFLLASIPVACEDLYAVAQEKIVEVYGEYVDYEGSRLLIEARTVWAASQNRDGALAAMDIVNRIAPEAACRAEADKFISEVGARIGEEWDLSKTLILGEQDLERERIEAGRQVGIAYGNNQQPSTLLFNR